MTEPMTSPLLSARDLADALGLRDQDFTRPQPGKPYVSGATTLTAEGGTLRIDIKDRSNNSMQLIAAKEATGFRLVEGQFGGTSVPAADLPELARGAQLLNTKRTDNLVASLDHQLHASGQLKSGSQRAGEWIYQKGIEHFNGQKDLPMAFNTPAHMAKSKPSAVDVMKYHLGNAFTLGKDQAGNTTFTTTGKEKLVLTLGSDGQVGKVTLDGTVLPPTRETQAVVVEAAKEAHQQSRPGARDNPTIRQIADSKLANEFRHHGLSERGSGVSSWLGKAEAKAAGLAKSVHLKGFAGMVVTAALGAALSGFSDPTLAAEPKAAPGEVKAAPQPIRPSRPTF